MTTTTLEAERRRRRRGRRMVAIAFAFPALAINLLVIAGPAVSSLYYAWTDWNGFSAPRFTGLENALRLMDDPTFWNALGHNFIWLAIFLSVPTIMGLVGAFMLSRIKRGASLFRVIFFIPYVIASVVNAQIWKSLLDPATGIAAQLDKMGITFLNDVYFFGDSNLSLYSVAFVDNWHYWGFLVVLFLAAMQGVEPALFEAARIDGASPFREFWHVTLPGIRSTLMFAIMIVSVGSLLAFDYSYAITGGGPAGSSDLVSLLINRTGLTGGEAGYASFMALVISLLGGIMLVIFHFIRRNEDAR
ncbi:carbohydrate ABC transporter permease [Herbidospora sp. RD11066]